MSETMPIHKPGDREPPRSGRMRATRQGSPSYERLRTTLERYISPIMVQGILTKALTHVGETETSLGGRRMHDVVEFSRVGIGLFVDEKRMPDLMMELTQLLLEDEPMPARGTAR